MLSTNSEGGWLAAETGHGVRSRRNILYLVSVPLDVLVSGENQNEHEWSLTETRAADNIITMSVIDELRNIIL